jgi:hypothetical protein
VTKSKPEPKLTDAERHARFKEMAREVEASEREDDFDRAFEATVSTHAHTPKSALKGAQKT